MTHRSIDNSQCNSRTISYSHIVLPNNLADIWKRECEKYIKNNNGYPQYIIDYCKPTRILDMYFANTFWNYSSDFINRILYVGENLYTIGNLKIQMQTFSNPTMPIASQKFKIQNYDRPIPIDIMPMSMMVR